MEGGLGCGGGWVTGVSCPGPPQFQMTSQCPATRPVTRWMTQRAREVKMVTPLTSDINLALIYDLCYAEDGRVVPSPCPAL